MSSPNTSPVTGQEMIRANQGDNPVWLSLDDVAQYLAAAVNIAPPRGVATMVELLPSASGNSGPAINKRLQQLAATGGGILYLGRGMFETDETIVIPTKCGLRGAAKESTILRKSAAFPDGNDLVSMAGVLGDNSGATHKTGMVLSDIQLSAGASPNIKSGLLLNVDFLSTSYIGPIRFVGSPGTAVSLREAWDCTFMDFSANNCGGPLGDADAVMRILGSGPDKANIITFSGTTRFETFRNMAISISDDGNGSNSGPYKIAFDGVLKLESTILVDNATLFRSRAASAGITIASAYLQFAAQAARTGIRGIDLDGQGHKVGHVQANIGANVALTSILKIPRASGGGRIDGPIRVTGNSTLSMILEADALNEAGNNVVYNERAMYVGTVAPFGAVPLIGGAGVDSAGYQFPQLDGTVARTITGNATVRRSEMNRILAANHANTTTPIVATIPPEGDRFGTVGDVITVSQEGAGAVTLAPFSGVTLQIPTGLSATTSAQFGQVRARKVATNTWRVF